MDSKHEQPSATGEAARLLALGLGYSWLVPPIALRPATTSLRVANLVTVVTTLALLLGAVLS